MAFDTSHSLLQVSDAPGEFVHGVYQPITTTNDESHNRDDRTARDRNDVQPVH